MKRVQKWLIRSGIALLVLVVVLASTGVWFIRRPWAQVSGTLRVAGLTAPVEIIRDRWGVPNIYAQNEHDLLFAQGYVHAQDRLWQMEMIRRISSGRMSEVMGAGTLPLDRYMRTFGLRRLAEMSWTKYDAESRAVLEDYAAGVNAYIDSHRNRLPLEYSLLGVTPEPWTPIDTLSWGNLMAANMSLNTGVEILRAKVVAKLGEQAAAELLQHPGDGPLVVPPEANGYHGFQPVAARPGELERWLSAIPWGSNNWVVSGSHTASGKPLLANDTHLSLYLPSYWYENGLHGGRFDSVGFSFPGVPLVVIGHNQQIGWGITNLDGDVQDLYLEKLDNRANPTRYEYQGQWHDLEIISETIQVKGGSDETLQVYLTRHGPLVNAIRDGLRDSDPIAQAWTINQGSMVFSAIRELNLASNWSEFRQALRNWDTLGENFVYADVQGNIGYQAAARIPIRAPGHTGNLPIPGWTGTYDWQGFVPFEELPSAFNPPEGLIVTANNKEPSDGARYPISNDWLVPSYRAERIGALLQSEGKVTIERMRAIQADTYALAAEQLRPYMAEVKADGPLQTAALAQFNDWDLHFAADSPGALIFTTWYSAIIQETLKDELGDLINDYHWRHKLVPVIVEMVKDPYATWFDDTTTAPPETRDDILARSLTSAVEQLSQEYGSDPSTWELGRKHRMSFSHLPFGESGSAPLEAIFNSRPRPGAGDSDTVNSLVMSEPTQFGTAQRLIIDFSDLGSSLAVNSTGQSGQLFHPHREDQIQPWAQVEYHQVPFTQEAVRDNAASVLTLTP